MFKLALIFFIIFVYLRKIFMELWKIIRINRVIDIYHLFKDADSESEKHKYFEQIAQNRPLSNELIGFYFDSPTYRDSINSSKIPETYFKLFETRDYCWHNFKKYFNPKYAVKDSFFLPSTFFEFIFKNSLGRLSSSFISFLSWTTTILITAYSNEVRNIIDNIIDLINLY